MFVRTASPRLNYTAGFRKSGESVRIKLRATAVDSIVETVNVDLGDRTYPIYIGPGLTQEHELLTKHIRGKRALVVTNETIAPLYLDRVQKALESKLTVDSVVLRDGEQFKNLEELQQVWNKALEARLDRGTTFVALGGGVIGDMTGFAAACFLRGVDFVQIPTTVMAQVDSSVGGKTGVNHPLGKNMIGAFYQPQSVLVDIDTLNTLRMVAFGIPSLW